MFRGPIFQHFIVVFAAESPYLWYRQKEWIASPEYTTNSTDDGQAYDEAWQAQNQITQNDTVRFRNRSVLGTQSNLHRFIRARRKRFPKHPPKSQMERVFGEDQQSRRSTYLLIGTGPPSLIRDGGLHSQPNPVRKYGRNWFGHGGGMKFQLPEHKLNHYGFKQF